MASFIADISYGLNEYLRVFITDIVKYDNNSDIPLVIYFFVGTIFVIKVVNILNELLGKEVKL